MNEVYASVFIAAGGMFASWAVWVTVMIFELREKIKLMKQEIEVLKEVRELLSDIRTQFHKKGSHHG